MDILIALLAMIAVAIGSYMIKGKKKKEGIKPPSFPGINKKSFQIEIKYYPPSIGFITDPADNKPKRKLSEHNKPDGPP